MKKGKIIVVLAVSACMLTGCIDSMPDMTEEQSELVAEYAADMLLKYSPNYHYRIADEEEVASAEAEMETSQEEETRGITAITGSESDWLRGDRFSRC